MALGLKLVTPTSTLVKFETFQIFKPQNSGV